MNRHWTNCPTKSKNCFMFERFFCCQHNAPSYLKVFTRRSVNAVKKLSFWNGRITYHQLDFKTGWTKPEVGWGKRGLIPKAQFCLLYLFLRLFHYLLHYINNEGINRSCFLNPTPTLMVFTGVSNAHGPSPSQQHAGLQHAFFCLYQEVTRPKARFKPTSPR